MDTSSFHSGRTAFYLSYVRALAMVQITNPGGSSAAEYTEEDSTVEGFSAWSDAFCDWQLDVVSTVIWVL